MSEVINDPNNTNQQPEKVEFSPEQQAKIDQIVRGAMGRAAADERKKVSELTEQVTRLTADLAVAREAAHDPSKTPAERKEAREQITSLQNAMDDLGRKLSDKDKELNRANQQITDLRKKSLIDSAAFKQNFVDADAVRALTERNFKWSESEQKFTIVNDDGTPCLNAAYEPMTPDEFFADFAAKRPYMVRSDAKGGNGSSSSSSSTLPGQPGRYQVEQIFGKKSSGRLANELAMKNPAEYKRLKAEARSKGLIA